MGFIPGKVPISNLVAWGAVTVVGLVLIAIAYPIYKGARPASKAAICFSNVSQLGMSLSMYENDYDDRLPIADTWCDLTMVYVADTPVFPSCPEVPEFFNGARAVGYAFNKRLDKAQADRVADPSQTILIYDSANLLRNATDPVTSTPFKGRHSGRNNFGYVDGHARMVGWSESPGIVVPHLLPEPPKAKPRG